MIFSFFSLFFCFYNGNSKFSIFVQSSFIPAPATSSLLTALPVTLSWPVASCFSLGLFSLPTAVSCLAVLIHKPKPVSLEECTSSGSVLCLSCYWHVAPRKASCCGWASVFTCECLKGVGPFLGIQVKATPISRSGKHLHFL